MRKNTLTLLIILNIASSCSVFKKGDINPADVSLAMNDNLELPQGSFKVDPDQVGEDNSVTITNGTQTSVNPINLGLQQNTQVSFYSPKGNVVGIGMRFGDSGPVNVIKIAGVKGQKAGTMTLPFKVSQQTCDNLGNICHQIKCQEFAYTAEGKLTKANINLVAISCGKCDDPSCKEIIKNSCQSFLNFDCDITKFSDYFTITFQNVNSWSEADCNNFKIIYNQLINTLYGCKEIDSATKQSLNQVNDQVQSLDCSVFSFIKAKEFVSETDRLLVR